MGLEVVGINVGESESHAKLYVEELDLTFKTALSGDLAIERRLTKEFGLRAYPTNYLIDSRGIVVYRGSGYREDELLEALRSLGVSH